MWDFIFNLIYFCLLSFYGRTWGTWRIPGSGMNQSYSCRPTPQPQRGIQAPSAIFITANSNSRSLTHWGRPGTEPESSWILLRFINCWATMGTPRMWDFNSSFSIIDRTHTCAYTHARAHTHTHTHTHLPSKNTETLNNKHYQPL